jgi:hypothetical protein
LAGSAPIDSATSLVEVDLYERDLFSTRIRDFKAHRTVAPRCPECGRRGYCVSICRRRAAGLIDIALRWVYLAQLEFSSGNGGPRLVRGAPVKGSRMR